MRSSRFTTIGSFCCLFFAFGCSKEPSSTVAKVPESHGTPTKGSELVGKAAPEFTLKDLEGRDVSLSSFKGKVVVLEWFNPGCPFVKAAHGKGSLKAAAKKHTDKGVVWLAINSGAKGKQGYELALNVEAAASWELKHPILRDELGVVGKTYSASNTPLMVVIDAAGMIAYYGAIDNSPDGEGASPIGGTLINYVDAAIEDLAAGRPVKTPAVKAYGCGVKYGA